MGEGMGIDEHIVKFRNLLGLAAAALCGAAGVPLGLLALIAEHAHPPFSGIRVMMSMRIWEPLKLYAEQGW